MCMKKTILLALLAVMTLATSCRSFNGPRQTKEWQAIIDRYAPKDSCTSLILVKYTGDRSNATVEYFVRNMKGRLEFDSKNDGYVGKNGIGKQKEGDKRTPVGEFNMPLAFGILENPGTELEYIDVTPTTFGCDNPEYYNQIIDTARTGHQCTGEEMFKIRPAYNYGIAIGYNPENIFGLGCLIFFHCKGTHPYTSGCVSVDEDFIKHVLQTCGTKPVISIH